MCAQPPAGDLAVTPPRGYRSNYIHETWRRERKREIVYNWHWRLFALDSNVFSCLSLVPEGLMHLTRYVCIVFHLLFRTDTPVGFVFNWPA